MSAAGRRPQPSPNANTSRSPSSKVIGSTSTALNGMGRSPSARGASGTPRRGRGGIEKPSPSTSFSNPTSAVLDDASEEEARAEHISLMEELRFQVQKAEAASEEYQRQLHTLQIKLNESLQEHGKLEDQVHEGQRRIEELETEAKQTTRQKQEMEQIFGAERNAMLQERSERQMKEEDLRSLNQRLKENLAQREVRLIENEDNDTQRNNTADDDGIEQFAPPAVLVRSESENHSRGIIQKDKVIEGLKLELAESQIKIMELENMGGSRLQELEQKMLETRITNARLLEENESFQSLLSDKTLNGDFSKIEVMHPSSNLGSLAEELESAEGESENYRRLELEAKSLKDQNKTLTLYIEKIIGRLLSHKEFENVLEKTPDFMSSIAQPSRTTSAINKEKDLPPPPQSKDLEPPSLLQRAKSVVSGPGRRPRPASQMFPVSNQTPLDEELSNPSSAAMARSQSVRTGAHRRSQSEMPMAAPIVNQMYRGPPSTGSGAPLSPGISPSTAMTRNPFFTNTTGAGSSNTTSRAPSGSHFSQEGVHSSSNSTFSDQSADISSRERNVSGSNNYTGAVMTQNRLRPLRLVQENREQESKTDEAAAKKKANRASWMPGWFNRGKEEERKDIGGENNFF